MLPVATMDFDCRGQPGGCLLSLARPRESNQREGRPKTCSLREYPALLASIGAHLTRTPVGYSNRSSRYPMFAAMLGSA